MFKVSGWIFLFIFFFFFINWLGLCVPECSFFYSSPNIYWIYYSSRIYIPSLSSASSKDICIQNLQCTDKCRQHITIENNDWLIMTSHFFSPVPNYMYIYIGVWLCRNVNSKFFLLLFLTFLDFCFFFLLNIVISFLIWL